MPEVKWNPELYSKQHDFVFKYGENVMEWLDAQEGETILDVGCGTGQLTKKISETGAVVTGIDASPDMIEKAKEQYAEIEFFVKDATNFLFDELFDAAFSNATLHWINKQEQALRCVYNALKPGGRFVFEMGGKRNINSIYNATKAAMYAEHIEDKIPSQTYYFPSVAEQSALLEKVGFTVSNVLYFDRPTTLKGEDGMTLWMAQFFGFLFKTVSPELVERVTNRAVEQLRKTNYCGGDWNADYVRLRVKAIKK